MKIAVLGMGRMGQALAERLMGAGHDLAIWNRTAGRAPELVSHGAREATSIATAVEGADMALTVLANDEAVRDVACGPSGLRGALSDGTVYVDSSTVSPALSDELSKTFRLYAAMPILGAPAAVKSGQATYLVGAEPAPADRVAQLFPGLSEKFLRYDAPSLASTAKITVNLLLLDGVVALAESFAVGRAGGLSDEQLRQLLGGSPMVAPGARARFEGILTGNQEAWWTVGLGAKDAGLAIAVAEAAGAKLPLTDTARELYQKTAAADKDADIAAVGQLYRQVR